MEIKPKGINGINGSHVIEKMASGVKRNRHSDEFLAEQKELILDKLKIAQEDYNMYKTSITQSDGNGTQDTSPTFKVLEEGAATLSKEESGKLAPAATEIYSAFAGCLSTC
jgi:hypothetical protein